jgi:Ca2+-binding EF-hand superfamily protein
MTAEDFVCALLGYKDNRLHDTKAASDLQMLFNTTDADGDGKLSFSEFSFLMVLLTTKQKDFNLCFQMLDTESRGSLSAEQFIACIRTLSGDDVPAGLLTKSLARGGGIMARLFGPNFGKRCTLKELNQVTEQLRLEVWKAEFKQFDPNGTGWIPAEKFAELIASQMLGSHLPFFLVQNMRTLKLSDQIVGFPTWTKLHQLMLAGDELAEAVQLYTRSGRPLYKTDLANAIKAIGQPAMTPVELDILFSLFDRDGSGAMVFDEFYAIMSSKINFHVKEKKRVVDDLFTRLVRCSGEAVDAALA